MGATLRIVSFKGATLRIASLRVDPRMRHLGTEPWIRFGFFEQAVIGVLQQ